MKIITLGVALSFLIGSTVAEGKGNFRHIYESNDIKAEKIKSSMAYMKNKMENVHNLDMKKNGSLEWDFYLFRKFIKSMLLRPSIFDVPPQKSVSYRGYRSGILFMLRSAESLRNHQDNDEALDRLTSNLISVDALKKDITQEEIVNWVRSSRDQQPGQISNKTEPAKNIVIDLWKEWRKIEVSTRITSSQTPCPTKL